MPDPKELDGAPIPVLMDYLGDDVPSTRADAACALGDRLRSREVDRLEPAVIERLAELLGDEVPLVQFEAAMALAEAHDHRATDLLLAAMRHRDFRLDAIRALGTMGDPGAVGPLRALMARWLMPWADRLQAAAALCALRDDEGAAYLVAKSDSRRKSERAAALHFIGESRHPDAALLLIRILDDPRDPMRDVAARALGFVTAPAARDALKRTRAGASGDLAEDIDEALRCIERELEPVP